MEAGGQRLAPVKMVAVAVTLEKERRGREERNREEEQTHASFHFP
jgi:hypothetical protein